MDMIIDGGLTWWITVVDIPIMSGLFLFVLKSRKESQIAVKFLHETLDVRTSQLREALLSFKLEVAKNYAFVTDMKDLENRIVSHLLRIESKLDTTALKTEALNALK